MQESDSQCIYLLSCPTLLQSKEILVEETEVRSAEQKGKHEQQQ